LAILGLAANNANQKIGFGKNVFDGKNPRFPVAACTTELPHQEIGIKHEDYETDFNDRSQNRV
jgi:hypothetical protein